MSITILPTAIWQLVRVDDPYVYKVFFQLVFAVCPVMVYLLARRYWSKRIAILSVIYFVGFPTFFTDMPFLNRQEIAFCVPRAGLPGQTRRQWSVMHRTVVLTLCGIGVGLSHYSTMYVFVGTLAVAWIAERLSLLGRLWHRDLKPKTTRRHRAAPRWADATRSVGLVAILALGAVTFVWGGVITRTTTGLTATVEQALPQFFGTAGGAHSNDSSYSLLPTSQSTPQELLDQYRLQTLHDRKVDDPGSYLPLSAAGTLPTHAVDTPSMPVSSTGRLLSDLHVPVPALNDAVRGLAAKGEQVFVVVGLLALGLVGWRRRQVGTGLLLPRHRQCGHGGRGHRAPGAVGQLRAAPGLPTGAVPHRPDPGHRFDHAVQAIGPGVGAPRRRWLALRVHGVDHRHHAPDPRWLRRPAEPQQQRRVLQRVLPAAPGGGGRRLARRRSRRPCRSASRRRAPPTGMRSRRPTRSTARN